jgi:hypothetical protein
MLDASKRWISRAVIDEVADAIGVQHQWSFVPLRLVARGSW